MNTAKLEVLIDILICIQKRKWLSKNKVRDLLARYNVGLRSVRVQGRENKLNFYEVLKVSPRSLEISDALRVGVKLGNAKRILSYTKPLLASPTILAPTSASQVTPQFHQSAYPPKESMSTSNNINQNTTTVTVKAGVCFAFFLEVFGPLVGLVHAVDVVVFDHAILRIKMREVIFVS